MKEYTVADCFYQIRNGANIKQGDATGGYPITRIETTANDTFNRDRMGYAGITDLSKYESYILEDGDLLMSHINSVQYLGRTVLYEKQEGETIIHGLNLLSLKANRDIVLPEFARYFFRSEPFKKQLSKITKKSVNQASFTVADLKKVVLSVPSLSKQNEIVQSLDKCRSIAAKRQQQLSALDDLIKARFVEMFGKGQYLKKTLISLIKENAGLSYGIVQPGDDGTGDMGVLRPVDFIDGHISTKSIKYIDRSIGDGFKKTELTGDELLITVRGTTGITALTDERFVGMNVTRGIAVIRYDRNIINPVFLNAYLDSDESQRYIQDHTRGATLQQINLSDLRVQMITVPPMELQNKFAAFAIQVDKSKSAIQKSLDETQLLFDSLIQQFFG